MKRLAYFLVGLALLAPASAETKEPPVPVRTVPPDYPQSMRRTGVSGVVVVSCLIDERGQVVDPKVEKSSETAFEFPALEALKKWKFKPARLDGVPTAVRISIPIKFVFNE